MPSSFTHPAVPLVLAALAGRARVSGRLLAAGVVASILPDADMLGPLVLGVDPGSVFGHRGFSHSLAFAAAAGIVALAFSPRLRAVRSTAFLFVFAAGASHGLLDMLTIGGSPVAYLWPLSDQRFFLPGRYIEASALDLHRFAAELRGVWLPAAAVAAIGVGLRRWAEHRPSAAGDQRDR